MNDSPIFQARQVELARLEAIETKKKFAEAVVEQELRDLSNQSKSKTKKKPETEEIVVSEVEKEVFPPILENKAIDSFEVKEEILKDEEIL